jgi:hypothetical protein
MHRARRSPVALDSYVLRDGDVAELIIGTTNAGKVRQMAGALSSLPVRCTRIDEVAQGLPVVDEVGDSAADVAATKALAYSVFIERPVLALDHWLRIPELPSELQPRAHVRRIPGHPDGASDDELIAHYRGLCLGHGGALTAEWELGIAYADGSRLDTFTTLVRRQLVPDPSPVRLPGLPLSALQIDPTTGRYISEHEADDEVALWQRVYGPELPRFVTAAMSPR